jgi:hypothetical protein
VISLGRWEEGGGRGAGNLCVRSLLREWRSPWLHAFNGDHTLGCGRKGKEKRVNSLTYRSFPFVFIAALCL